MSIFLIPISRSNTITLSKKLVTKNTLIKICLRLTIEGSFSIFKKEVIKITNWEVYVKIKMNFFVVIRAFIILWAINIRPFITSWKYFAYTIQYFPMQHLYLEQHTIMHLLLRDMELQLFES